MRATEAAAHLLDGLQYLLGRHLARLALVRALLRKHRRRAVFLVAAVPSLDGAPREAKALPVLVDEGLLAHVPDARHDGFARRGFDGAEHAHFQIAADSFH
jgi:hypothetical protein